MKKSDFYKLTVAAVALLLALGCGKKEETPVTPEASTTTNQAAPAPEAPPTPQQMEEGSGSAGLRSVPPTQEGDRS